jgi:hypothetical protein
MPAEPTVIADRYVLAEPVGSGGMGVVWRGFDELLQRPVAVKELHFPADVDSGERERLARRTLREARAVAKVDDPSAVRVFDIVEQDGRPWIVMEYLDGVTLTELLRERGPLPEHEVVRVGQALLNALDAAHSAGVLHRDVKPSNVMVSPEGRVALTDFGIATSIDGESGDTTSSGVIVGSPAYMAPERARGEPPSPASDLWSLGATLWTAAEGRAPFDGPTAIATMTSVATEPPPVCQRCDGALGSLLQRMMARDPNDRPTLDDVRRELSALRGTASHRPVATQPYPTERLPVAFDRTTALEPIEDGPVPAPAPAVAAPSASPAPAAAVAPAPVGDGLPRRRSPAGLVVALVLLLVAAAVGAAVLLGGGGGSKAKVSGEATPSAKASSHSASRGLPSGWHRYRNSSLGWSVGVPAGWQVSDSGQSATFTDPAGGRYVKIDTRYPAGPSAVGAWQDQERAFSGTHSGYHRIRLETVSYGGYRDAADWEFTYTSGAVTLHALDRGFVTSGNRGYAVYFQTHDDQWSSSAATLRAILSSFRP